MTTKNPVITLGGNEGGGEEFPFGFFDKKGSEPTPAPEKSGGGEEFPYGKIPEGFFDKKKTPSTLIGKSGGGDEFPFDKMPKGFFVKDIKKTTATPVVVKSGGGDLFPFDKVPGDNFFDKFVARQSKTTARPVNFELSHADLLKELEKYEQENKDKKDT